MMILLLLLLFLLLLFLLPLCLHPVDVVPNVSSVWKAFPALSASRTFVLQLQVNCPFFGGSFQTVVLSVWSHSSDEPVLVPFHLVGPVFFFFAHSLEAHTCPLPFLMTFSHTCQCVTPMLRENSLKERASTKSPWPVPVCLHALFSFS
jgi:hypothetical protein